MRCYSNGECKIQNVQQVNQISYYIFHMRWKKVEVMVLAGHAMPVEEEIQFEVVKQKKAHRYNEIYVHLQILA